MIHILKDIQLAVLPLSLNYSQIEEISSIFDVYVALVSILATNMLIYSNQHYMKSKISNNRQTILKSRFVSS
ncbi:unnamed protein product [Citrullus colocynthis]|uniref:Uncharacterized protein n=1 Tax=Citrullus colocynthis TaxID=252529 RepID=A0ABP0YGR2_9ROSI